ncbi:MAG: tetratricopeptide repeat protein [Saprospiraceae bacterium]
MKNSLLTIALLVLPFLVFSQTEKPASAPARQDSEGGKPTAGKGFKPLTQSTNPQSTNHQTRSVVIGISDYQDKDIPDLRFADKDAEAFANFLRSPAGGSLDADHLKVLTNSEATAGRIAEALDALVEQASEGEQVIIYFSGHGDVERKTISQPGFLLCWDAPSRVYMGGGTYSLAFLQEIVSTLSTQNQAKVIVIADACHAGKLSGNQIGGAQLTAANLAKQFSNEVKILSCQPGEFSLEGEQWGGGRGCFSYHLVDGLFGLADRNSDASVTVGELDRYLEDRVTAEAAPQRQVPMLLGNKTERVAIVNAALLADLQKYKTERMPIFTATESRGMEDEVLARVDSSVRELYRSFNLAVQEKRFFPVPTKSGAPSANCAEDYFARIVQVKELAPLQSMIKRNYAAALQDDAQQVMNKWLKTDVSEIIISKRGKANKYLPYPRYLERAAELLGKEHYMYPVLQARMHFFEGYLLAMSSQKAQSEKALVQFRRALQWQADLPQAYWQMSLVFGYNLDQLDSAEHCARQAIELEPSWVLPYTSMAFLFAENEGQFNRAKPYLEQASRLDSSSVIVWNDWGTYFRMRKEYEAAERHCKKAIQLDSTYIHGYISLGKVYIETRNFAAAEWLYKKAILLDSSFVFGYNNLGWVYIETHRYAEAESMLLRAISLYPKHATARKHLGTMYFRTGHLEEARKAYEKALELNPNYFGGYLGMAYLSAEAFSSAIASAREEAKADSATTKALATKAFGFVEQAIQKKATFEELESDTDLAPLRALPEWKELMKKYFPDQVKD